eukprot:TRINITY_DN35824_c0_g2_i1.p1 TRINITY_DN35824_c0_g2~~TRINITY_DN35824_c0_g2_i1.p1  ORF type:complete len:183 (+),score=115.12 TRINITY_DN35824_c0_g2_i1:77-550(+)
MGADYTVNHHEDLKPQLEKIGLADGVDVVFNCSEADGNWDVIPPILKQLGRVLLITGMHKPINPTALMFKRCSLHWELMFSRTIFDNEPEKQGEILQRFASWVDAGVIDPRVRDDHRFESIADLPKAFDIQKSGKAIGKIVLAVDKANWDQLLSSKQ